MGSDLIDSKSNRSLELKKHVGLIHSSGKISLLQRKIANALLYNAYEDLLEKSEYSIPIGELTNLIGYDSNDHRKIKEALIELLSTVIEWNIVDGNKIDAENIWNASSIISEASIKGSICTYSYSNKMRNLLYHPQIYGRLNLHIQARFQSGYGLALYENCNRYRNIGQTPWFDLDTFRKLMGVEEDKYKIFRDLKSRVISKAIEEINKYSDLQVDAQYKKINRQVTEIQFTIDRNKNNEPPPNQPETDAEPDDMNGELRNTFGLSRTQIQAIVSQYDNQYIEDKIKIIKKSANYAAGKIKNLGTYFMCALRDDYQAAKSSRNIQDDSNKAEKVNKLKYDKYLFDEVLKTFTIIEDNKKAHYILEFESYMTGNIYNHLYKIHGIDNILVKEQFVKFISNNKNFVNEYILKYEDWLEEQGV